MNILYRVDAGNIIGTGHLMEIVSIQNALQVELQPDVRACINESPLTAEHLATAGVKDIRVISTESETEELDQLERMYAADETELIILDLLDRSAEYYSAIRKIFKHTIVILDNADHVQIDADLCINFSILQDTAFYERPDMRYGTVYWTGPHYLPFSSSIRDLRTERIGIRKKVETLFVNQGGSDPYHLTAKSLASLEALGTDSRVIVVTGGGITEACRRELDEMKKRLNTRYEFYQNIPLEKMHILMAESDIALTAAGNTLYEFALLGIPCIVISHHERHDQVATAFEKRNALINLGIGQNIGIQEIASAVKTTMDNYSLRKRLSDQIRTITDGGGTDRLVGYISRWNSGTGDPVH